MSGAHLLLSRGSATPQQQLEGVATWYAAPRTEGGGIAAAHAEPAGIEADATLSS